MKLKLFYIVWFLLFTFQVGKSQETEDFSELAGDSVILLNLRQAIEMARENSPEALAARHTFRSSYWNYRTYKASFLPLLSLSSSPELRRTISKVTLENGSEKYVGQNMLNVDGTVSIRQNVPFTGGTFFIESAIQRMKLYDTDAVSFRTSPINIGYQQSLFGYNSMKWSRRIEPLRYEKAQKTYIESMEVVAASAVSKFFALAQAQSNYESARFNYANADTLYQYAKGRYDIGTITENELLQLEINRLTESTNQMDAQIEVDNCMQELRSFLGLEKNVKLKVQADVNVPDFKVNPDEALKLFIRNSPDIQTLKINLIEGESSVAQARANAGLKADLYLECGLSQTAADIKDAYRDPLDQQQVRIGISLPVLDWGQAKGKVRVAKSRLDLTKVQVDQQWNDLEMDIRKLVLQFNLQAERVKIAAKTDETAQRRHGVARKLYLLGKSLILDLNASISEKDSARRSYLSAINTYWRLYYLLRSMTLYDFEYKRPITEDYKALCN